MYGDNLGAIYLVGVIVVGSWLAAFCGFWGWVAACGMYDAIMQRREEK